MRVLVIVASLVLCQQVVGWPWRGSEESDPVFPAAATANNEMARCLRAGQEGRCEFYDCLEERFSCGADGYTVNISKHFCQKIDSAYRSFTNFGRLWLNRTSRCLMSNTLSIYSGESTSCGAIRQAGTDGIVNCNEGDIGGRGFCDFVAENSNQYSSLMGVLELKKILALRNMTIYRTMVRQQAGCHVQAITHRVNGILESMSTTVEGWFSSLSQTVSSYFNSWFN